MHTRCGDSFYQKLLLTSMTTFNGSAVAIKKRLLHRLSYHKHERTFCRQQSEERMQK